MPNYSFAEHITESLRKEFLVDESKKAAALTYLQSKESEIELLLTTLDQAWKDKKPSPRAIGFQSCVKIAFTQNEEVKTLLLDEENIKIIFYLSALALWDENSKTLRKVIFEEGNSYTGLFTTLCLNGADVKFNGKDQEKTTNSLFAYIFLNVPDILHEMQVNGRQSDTRLLDDRTVQEGKSFYQTLDRKIKLFAQQENISIIELKEHEKFLEEPYNHNKWQEYIARFEEIGLMYQGYSISDRCDRHCSTNLDNALQDINKIYLPGFAHFNLDPKHLASVLGSNKDYAQNKAKFFQLLEKISSSKDPEMQKAGEYIFKRLKLLEFETYKDCYLIKVTTEDKKQQYSEYQQKYKETPDISFGRAADSEKHTTHNHSTLSGNTAPKYGIIFQPAAKSSFLEEKGLTRYEYQSTKSKHDSSFSLNQKAQIEFITASDANNINSFIVKTIKDLATQYKITNKEIAYIIEAATKAEEVSINPENFRKELIATINGQESKFDIDDLCKKAINLSVDFQIKTAEKGIMTGRAEENTDIVGLRLKRLPIEIVDYFKELDHLASTPVKKPQKPKLASSSPSPGKYLF